MKVPTVLWCYYPKAIYKFLQCGFSSIGLGLFYLGACVLRYLKTVSLCQSADTNRRCILMYFRMSVIFAMYSLSHRHNVNQLTISWALVSSCWLFYYVSVRSYPCLSVWPALLLTRKNNIWCLQPVLLQSSLLFLFITWKQSTYSLSEYASNESTLCRHSSS
jgi:hypothetical protein